MYTFDENILSDLHKDAYGVRPGESFWATFAASDGNGKQAIWDQLVDDLRNSIEEEDRYHNEAQSELEERITFIMTTCSCMREDAIRYLHDAYNTNGDIEYLEHCLGVRFGYLSKKNYG